MGETIRIYVGGLGAGVQEDDLKKTFGSLGRVEAVELNRNKGMSFGYMEFVPASAKSLPKLFSAIFLFMFVQYNGCMWKGGKLKLEKAKEHYLSRLRHEWTEDSELAIKLASKTADGDEMTHTPTKFKADQDIEKMQLSLFPQIEKGTGKHKYSFQRTEIPPLPINFCDCEDHSGPPVSAKRNDTTDIEPENFVVNEEELSIMKSVLNKLLEKENSSSKVSNKSKFTEKINHPVTSGDNTQVVNSEEGQVSDDDVVINVVGRSSNRVYPFEDWQQKTTNQDSLSIEMESFTRSQKTKLLPDKKRKAHVSETETKDNRVSKRMVKNDILSSNSVPKATQLSSDVATVHNKTAWKNLVTEKGSTFQISNIFADLNPEGSKPKNVVPCSNKKDRQDEQTDKTKELENLSDGQLNKSAESESHGDQTNENKELETPSVVNKPNKSSESDSKSARGAAWLHKLSWTQLVGDTSSRSFNLSQILTGEKQESPQFESNDFSDSKDENFLIGDGSKPDERSEEALLEKEENAELDGDKISSDGEQKVEQNNRAFGGDIVISETCPFMRSSASMKQWAKTKAALSGSLKKKPKVKETDSD